MIERLLQALLGMVIDDRRAQRVQVERDCAVVDFALVSADHVASTFAERRDRHAVRIAQLRLMITVAASPSLPVRV